MVIKSTFALLAAAASIAVASPAFAQSTRSQHRNAATAPYGYDWNAPQNAAPQRPIYNSTIVPYSGYNWYDGSGADRGSLGR